MDSTGKSILFIGPAFFGYEISIKNALIANGFNVDYYDERTSNNSFLKAIFRVQKKLLNVTIFKYYQHILRQISNKSYDYFFLIKGEVVPQWFLIDFKRLNPDAKLIYYTYDSFNNNNSNSVYILKHFDACYSFDFEDVKANPELKLKHLFYTGEFISKPASPAVKPYAICFIGTLHSNRYRTIKSLFSKFDTSFLFFYLPAKWLFALNKLTKKEYKNLKWSEVSFAKLTKQEVADVFKQSTSVLDIQRHGQTGLTMRTFEVLAAGSVLITTNPYIKLVDFYNEDNIIVLTENNLTDVEDAIKNRMTLQYVNNPPKATLERYFVNNWILEFFE